MAFEWFLLVRAIHILGAIVWVGSMVLIGAVIMPAVKAARLEEAFLVAILRRGGFGRLFHVVGPITVAAGALLYWHQGFLDHPFADAATTDLTIAGIFGLVAVAYSTFVLGPAERRAIHYVRALPIQPGPRDMDGFRVFHADLRKRIALGAPLIFVIVLMMLARPLLA